MKSQTRWRRETFAKCWLSVNSVIVVNAGATPKHTFNVNSSLSCFKVTKCRKRKRESVRMVSQSGTVLLCPRLSPRHKRSKESIPLAHAEESNPRYGGHAPSLSLCCLFFCSEVWCCLWLQKANTRPVGVWIISVCVAASWFSTMAVNPQTDWSLLLRFWTEVIMLEVKKNMTSLSLAHQEISENVQWNKKPRKVNP